MNNGLGGEVAVSWTAAANPTVTGEVAVQDEVTYDQKVSLAHNH